MDVLANNIIVKGGWVMIPIILGAIIAFGLAVERGMLFWKIRIDMGKFANDIFALLEQGRRDLALDTCDRTHHPIGRVFGTGIRHWQENPADLEPIMEHAGNHEVALLEKNMGALMIIIGVEPMMGFLGTILGLIRSFMSWEAAGASVGVERLAAGIYQAMITTAGGLIVAAPFFIIYSMYNARINSIARDMNHYGEELLSIMKTVATKKRK